MVEAKVENKLEYITSIIQKTEDRKLLRLLNNAWWKEYFRIMEDTKGCEGCKLVACKEKDRKASFMLPGWACGVCHTYNGLQRNECKSCNHPCCIEKPLPEVFGLCNTCGVPEGMAHRGH